jgi:prefoldin subunit 5
MMTDKDIKRLNDSTVEELKKRIKELEGKCREAGRAMIELNVKYESSLKQVEELKANLARAKEDHQYDKMAHKKELESVAKK